MSLELSVKSQVKHNVYRGVDYKQKIAEIGGKRPWLELEKNPFDLDLI